jgi:hypothetical protein
MTPTYMVDDRTLSTGTAIRKKILESSTNAPIVHVINTKRFMIANRSNNLDAFINDEFGIRPLVAESGKPANATNEQPAK